MHEYKFDVEVPCPACIDTVKRAFLSCKNEITSGKMQVDLQGNLATVRLSQAKFKEAELRKKLCEAVEDAGYECKDHQEEAPKKKKINHHLILGIVGVVLGAVLLGLCLSGVGIPFAATLGIAAFSTVMTVILGKDTFQRAAQNIKNLFTRKEKTLSMDVLIAFSSIIAVGISIGSLFVPWLPMMFDTALLILGFTHLGHALKKSQNQKADKKLDFLNRKDSTVEALNPNNKKMKIAELKPGQIIRIYAGQSIPVDGYCLSEGAGVCKIIDSGEKNLACPVKKGELLQAGWEVPQGQAFIDLRVDKEETKSTVAQMNIKYKLAQAEKLEKRKKQPFEKIASVMTNYFVPAVLGIALISAILIGTLVSPLGAFQAIASILASACPCTLGLIIPFAIKTALVKAAADGILIKSQESFPLLAEGDTLIFDWCGTLTTGEPQVVYTNLKAEDFPYLAALEGQSNHHFAAAICEHIKKRKAPGSALKVSGLEAHHSGLMASIKPESKEELEEKGRPENVKYLAGNSKYMAEMGIDVSAYDWLHQIERQKKQTRAQFITYFARRQENGEYQIRGHVLLRDPIRPDSAQLIRDLKQQGIKVGIWSGSENEQLTAFAKELKVDYFQSNCPGSSKQGQAEAKYANPRKSKEELMMELKRQGRKVIMVGDSANDVFAMVKSDFSIAIKSKNAHGLTEQTADAVIDPKTSPDPAKPLHPILSAIFLAKQTKRSVKTNLAINLVYNLLSSTLFTALLVGVGFALNPAIGAALMVLQAAFMFWNMKRMIHQKAPYANDPKMAPPEQDLYQLTYLPPALKPKPAPSKSVAQQAAHKNARQLFPLGQASKAPAPKIPQPQPSIGVLRW